MAILLIFGYRISGAPGEPEEIGFVLFLPNSSTKLANEKQAMAELDKLAEYLRGRDLSAGQISILGYAAAASNNIDSKKLSAARALYVTQELQKRGVRGELFSEPVAYGESNTWGRNTTEESRRLNRRVRIMLNNVVDNIVDSSVPAARAPEETDKKAAVTGTPTNEADPVIAVHETPVDRNTQTASLSSPWFLLLLILMIGVILCAILLFILSKEKEKSTAGTVTVAGSNTNVNEKKNQETSLSKRSNFMEMEKTVRDIIIGIPSDMYFDVHTIVEMLLQEHDEVYLTNVGHYTSAAHYHSKISTIVAENTDIVERIGNSFSKNIHDKFTDCHLFRHK